MEGFPVAHAEVVSLVIHAVAHKVMDQEPFIEWRPEGFALFLVQDVSAVDKVSVGIAIRVLSVKFERIAFFLQ